MRVYGELLPWRKSEVKEIIGALDTGNCIFVNGDRVQPIYVRERRTFHAGFTPTLETVTTPELKQVSVSIIEAIERARNGKERKTRTQELENLLERMEEKLAEKNQKILELEEVARTLGYIKLELPVGGEVAWSRGPAEGRASFTPHMIGVRHAQASGCELAVQEPCTPHDQGDVIDIAEEERGPTSDQLPPAVLRHLDRFVKRMERKNILQRRLLAFLVEHSPGSYTVDQIAAWTSCAPELIQDEPPIELMDVGLIERERRSDGLRYRSSLKRFVANEFGVYQPDIGEGGLHSIAQRLRQRLSAVGVA
jgi:hypothetical protein